MNRCLMLTALLLCCTPAPAQEAADGKADEGFRPLFDGKSFDGWKVTEATPKSWKIEDGLLVLTGGSSHLFTNDEFEDFVVRFQWRPAKKGYNSGFLLRGRQIQMADGGAGMLFGSKEAKAVPKLHNPPGQWNEWEVTCIGPRLSLKVNGQAAWEINDFPAARRPLGFEAEGHEIAFRNIRVKTASGKQEPKSVALSFTGPFSPEKQLNDKPVGASWIQISRVRFCSYLPYEYLDIEYNATAELDTCRQMHVVVTVTDDNGKVYMLLDQTRMVPGPRSDIVAGSLVLPGDSATLPIRLSSVARLDMRFAQEATP